MNLLGDFFLSIILCNLCTIGEKSWQGGEENWWRKSLQENIKKKKELRSKIRGQYLEKENIFLEEKKTGI